jgi:hypothetical protein
VKKIARRAGGFVLLTLTVGLTTCSALDAVKLDPTPGQLERPAQSDTP